VNLLLLHASELDAAHRATIADARVAHLQSVLQVSPGQTVRVGVIDGAMGVGTVEEVAERSVTLRCVLNATVPPRPRVDLLLALPRPKVLKRLWAQLAALGVGRIIITNAAKVERHYFDTHILTPASYAPLLLEGLEQARDTRVPRVSVHRRFRVLIEDDLDTLCPGSLRLVAHPGAATRAAQAATRAGDGRVLLALGPEGGWTDFELQLLAAYGFDTVGAGARALRSDTAAIALLALVHEALRSAAPVHEP
jgi:RsmE family RNA methyltransferase